MIQMMYVGIPNFAYDSSSKPKVYVAYVYDNFISRHCHFFFMVLVILKEEKEPRTHPNH